MKLFQNLTLILLGVFIISCQKKVENGIHIIPEPTSLKEFRGSFEIDDQTRIFISGDKLSMQTARYLKDQLDQAGGFDLLVSDKLSESNQNTILFALIDDHEIGPEGYDLLVEPGHVKIKANSSAGLFYGIQTLLQLMPAGIFAQEKMTGKEIRVPCCQIRDYPRFEWRGMHLDVSRHFFPVSFIKRYIDLIAMHKMNVFHWHLTDDNGWRIEIEKYPLLTEVSAWRVDREHQSWRERTPPEPGEKATYGGFYTREEIREVVKYASERHVEVVPEIEMPGHTSEVFAAYPELSCRGEKLYVQPGSYWPNIDVFCAGKEETFEFLENVLAEVITMFPSEYIHIGGDEADKTRWKACPLCQNRINTEGLEDEDGLQSYFIHRIEKFLNAHGKKLIGWDEILEGGLAPEATVMSWRGFEGGIEAAQQGHDVIMCPVSHCYFDYYQADPEFEPEAIGGFTPLKKVYAFNPVPEELTGKEAEFIIGGQGNVWTEFIPTPEHAEYMALPRMTALAEVLWLEPEQKDWADFRKRLETQFLRFDQMGVNYSKGSWKVTIEPAKSQDGTFLISLQTEQYQSDIRYTLDGSDPDAQSPVYSGPFRIDSSVVIKTAIFEHGKLKEKISKKEVILHKGAGKPISLTHPPSKRYAPKGEAILADGLKGTLNHRDNSWLGFRGNELELEMTLDDSTIVRKISIDFLHKPKSWIFSPLSVSFELLDDQKQIVSREVIESAIEPESIDDIKVNFAVVFNSISANFLRIKTQSHINCPPWHDGAGQPAWIFTDELVVE